MYVAHDITSNTTYTEIRVGYLEIVQCGTVQTPCIDLSNNGNNRMK